ncbi:MAG TPA: protein kinase [Gemmatimonadaceae bacterium]|nr:protein kinase [Gemmatimonadaceae bacterium]
MTSPADRVIGRLIADRYRVVALVGSGGMGEVYRAEHVGLRRPTALKFMRPALGQDADALARFRREAEQASRISHPNVAAIYDFGDAGDGHVFLAMEFIEGESLADRIARVGRLAPSEAAHIILGAAAGLAAAHRRGILHRDLKPANIMLAAECGPDAEKDPHAVGTVKLVDFGIARSIMGDIKPADGAAPAAHSLTKTGMVLGTPAYASPEQLAGEPLDARSDLYALGLIAFESLTGQPAFATTNARELIAHRLLGSPRAVSDVLSASEAPWADAVQPVLDRALSSDPAKRYGEATAFAADFAAALGVAPATPSTFGASTPAAAREPAPSATPVRDTDPRRRALLAGLGVAGVLLVGAIMWKAASERRARATAAAPASAPAAPAVQRLAVLPFENLGRPEDAYVVDGLTDEIRSKLAGVPGLQVIARASSNQYRETKKPLQDVARELGVQYLLTGTVRSEPAAAGRPARVRVNPELVEISTGSAAPVSRWTRSLDATMADVFAMQADIAGRVAGAMNVALAGGTRAHLAEAPTRNPAAYDAYLHGRSIARTDPADLRRKLRYFQQATSLDSSFVEAWVERSRTASILYSNSVPDPAVAREARAAAERAITVAPDRGIAHAAMAVYRNLVESDASAALEAALRARALAPGDPDILRSVAIVERQQGRIVDAIRDLQLASDLDPRNAITVHTLAEALMWARRWSEARAAADRALALAPDVPEMIEGRAMVSLAEGDLAGARRVFAASPPSLDRAALAASVGMYFDLAWALDDADQRRILPLGPDAFDGDRLAWAWVLAQTHAVRGDSARARAYADTALVAADEQLRDAPDDPQRHMVRGLVLAAIGRPAEAISAGERAIALAAKKTNATLQPYLQHQLAKIHIAAGERAKAMSVLEPLLRGPYYMSPAWLRLDPTFAPLRGDERFERLASSQPVVFER